MIMILLSGKLSLLKYCRQGDWYTRAHPVDTICVAGGGHEFQHFAKVENSMIIQGS